MLDINPQKFELGENYHAYSPFFEYHYFVNEWSLNFYLVNTLYSCVPFYIIIGVVGKKFGVTDFINPTSCTEKSVPEVIFLLCYKHLFGKNK